MADSVITPKADLDLESLIVNVALSQDSGESELSILKASLSEALLQLNGNPAGLSEVAKVVLATINDEGVNLQEIDCVEDVDQIASFII